MKKFKAQTERILQMMINSVYTNKEIFLRELVANASDACDKARFLSLTDSAYLGEYSIKIEADKENRVLSISDNGIGMSEKELETNLGVIAQSDTAEFKQNPEIKEKLIGQFGVGFYSAFMVAKKIEVISARANESAHVFSSDASGYSIEPYLGEFSRGTKINLYLREPDDDMDYNQLLQSFFIEDLIKKYSDYIGYPIYVFGSEKPVNSMIPIWKRAKTSPSEEIDSFFMSKYYFDKPPLKTFSYSIEGNVSYRALLFVPQNVPYDYFSVEYERGLSLYNSGVMIMENCKELLPDYLAFVKGVIESEDVSLNISRELMQKDRKLAAISKNIEKKVLSELEKMLKNEREVYERFFNAFGSSIKLGIYTSFGVRKEELKDLLLYYSSANKGLVSLSEYVSRLGEDKKEILYACGEDVNSIEKSPVMDYIRQNNREVLFLTDKIDEFVIKILNAYNDVPFVSVHDFEGEGTDKSALDELNEKHKKLLADIADILKDRVGSVKLSSKLGNSLCMLSSSNDISLQMEKVLNAVNKENKAVSARVLEINPFHALFERLVLSKNLKAFANMLYYQAVLLSGLEIDSPYELCSLFNELLLES